MNPAGCWLVRKFSRLLAGWARARMHEEIYGRETPLVMWNAVRLLRAASPRRGIYREREDRPFLNCISNNSSYSNITRFSPYSYRECTRAREWAREGGFEGATSDSLHVCTVSAATLPIYRDDEYRKNSRPDIPVNGGPVPTRMRLPAIHDQV